MTFGFIQAFWIDFIPYFYNQRFIHCLLFIYLFMAFLLAFFFLLLLISLFLWRYFLTGFKHLNICKISKINLSIRKKKTTCHPVDFAVPVD